MSIAKKFFSVLSVLAIATSVLPSTTAHAADGIITGTASNLVFCNGAATPNAPTSIIGTTATLSPSGTYFVARNSTTASGTLLAGTNTAGQCINTLSVAGVPSFSNHRTSFTVRLDGTAVSVSNVIVSNNAPTVPTTTVCVVKDGRANFVINDSESDQVTAVAVVSPINGFANGTGNSIQYTPNSGFVGTDTFSFDIQDKVMMAGETLAVTVTPGTTGTTAGTNDTTYSVNASGIRMARVNLNAIVVENTSSCPNASSSSMMSSMMSSSMMSSSMSSMSSSMMSSSMMSSDSSSSMMSSMSSSSMMSSSKSSAPVVVYIEVPVSGKGTTIRTGANI